MRISQWIGVWLQYRDSARPVVTLNQVLYAFNDEARECLVSREDHLRYFLETGQYRIAGLEVADGGSGPIGTLGGGPRGAARGSAPVTPPKKSVNGRRRE